MEWFNNPLKASSLPNLKKKGLFRPEAGSSKPPFAIVIPPPNVTGSLHMGHALNNTLQDILIRYKRMDGFNALWLPGTDHAGIATQNVVEKQLAALGTDRHAVGRDGFINRVWQWREESGEQIIQQLKRLGASCDWERERFTMDEGLSKAVREVLVRLYEEGLIYRANRLINWCPRCHTALSDIEVEHEDLIGELVYIEYPFAEGGGGIEVATTRAETMLGDTAVAVHPDDERYRGVVGRMLRLPLVGREIPCRRPGGGSRLRHRRGEGDPGARPHRLRDSPAVDYENLWEDRPEFVHSGKLSARIRCTGVRGRIGISTAPLPVVPGVTEYKLSFWARGEGDNMLFVNFEEGATGTLREKIGDAWKQYTLAGTPAAGKKTYFVYFYSIGGGTIWLDDVELVPVGGKLDE